MEANSSSGTMQHGSSGVTLRSDGYLADAPRRVVQRELSSQVRAGALQQLQRLRDDLIRKSSIPSEPSNGAITSNIPLSEDVKLRLAVQLSVAGIPGAHSSNLQGGNARKPQTLQQDASCRTRDMDDIVLSDSISIEMNPINDLQMRMHTFRFQTFKEDEWAHENQAKRRNYKRRTTAIVLVVIVAIVVGTIVGVLRATNNNRKDDEPTNVVETTGGEAQFERCYSRNDTVLTERYDKFRSAIVTQFPDMKTDLDTRLSAPNAALCWVSMYDEFLLEIDDGNHSAFDILVQRFALAAVLYRFEGTTALSPRDSGFETWLSSSGVCQWSLAIECSDIDDREVVTGLYFKGINLNGSLPSELALLTNLVHLEFEPGTMLTGAIPSELWRLTLLEEFIIPTAAVNGTLSNDLGNLSHLKILNLFNTAISGTIPELSTLSELTSLEIVSDFIDGSLPNLGALTKLGE